MKIKEMYFSGKLGRMLVFDTEHGEDDKMVVWVDKENDITIIGWGTKSSISNTISNFRNDSDISTMIKSQSIGAMARVQEASDRNYYAKMINTAKDKTREILLLLK